MGECVGDAIVRAPVEAMCGQRVSRLVNWSDDDRRWRG